MRTPALLSAVMMRRNGSPSTVSFSLETHGVPAHKFESETAGTKFHRLIRPLQPRDQEVSRITADVHQYPLLADSWSPRAAASWHLIRGFT